MKTCLFVLLFTIVGTLPEDKTVEVYRVEKEDTVEIHARNGNPYPVTIEVKLDIKNLKSNVNLPYVGVLAPHSDFQIMVLDLIQKNKPWDYNATYVYYMGDIFAEHNDRFAYRLPFSKAATYKVDQGFGGTFSHQGAMQYSVDINMPTGTAVLAARGGTVVKLEEENKRGGPTEDMMEFANFITILHDDNTFADYSHLKYQGVAVKIGQQVRMGQVIGYSGATGYATGPHLHFAVKKTKKGGGFTTIPVKFSTKDGIQQLVEGKRYIGY